MKKGHERSQATRNTDEYQQHCSNLHSEELYVLTGESCARQGSACRGACRRLGRSAAHPERGVKSIPTEVEPL